MKLQKSNHKQAHVVVQYQVFCLFVLIRITFVALGILLDALEE